MGLKQSKETFPLFLKTKSTFEFDPIFYEVEKYYPHLIKCYNLDVLQINGKYPDETVMLMKNLQEEKMCAFVWKLWFTYEDYITGRQPRIFYSNIYDYGKVCDWLKDIQSRKPRVKRFPCLICVEFIALVSEGMDKDLSVKFPANFRQDVILSGNSLGILNNNRMNNCQS